MKKQKIFTVLLMLLVAFTVKSQTATPPAAGNGSTLDPYQIATLENLYWITQNSSKWILKSYIQTADIDASSTVNWNPNGTGGNYGFPSIGDITDKFDRCKYNGQGYTIDGLYINRPETDYVGLFGWSDNSIIQDLGLTNVIIYGDNNVGAVIGRNQNLSYVKRCYSTGVIHGSTSVGGLVGRCYDDGIIWRSYSTVRVYDATSNMGGLVGSVGLSTVLNCYSLGYVEDGTNNAGGLIGSKSVSTVTGSFWNTETSGQATSAGGTGKTTAEMTEQCLYLDGTEASWDFLIETQNSTLDRWGMNASENDGYPFLAWQGYTQTEECCGYIDFTDPVLVVQNFTIQLDETGNAILTNVDVVISTTDNCPDADTTLSQSAFDCSDIGTPINVDVTLSDGVGNSDTETAVITVEDNIVPLSQTLADVTGECSATAETPTTTDNCAGTVIGATFDNLTYDSQGTYTITWNFDDGNGNSIDVEQSVIVDDITDPEVGCVDNQAVDADPTHVYGVSGTEFDYTYTDDNCGITSITNDFNNSETLNGAILPEGTTTIIWTVSDVNNNNTDCSFEVTVNAFVGMKTLLQTGISFFPNPTKGIINFEFANNNIKKITISDIRGKDVIEKTELQQNETINLSNLENGIYIINIQTVNEMFITKIVKE